MRRPAPARKARRNAARSAIRSGLIEYEDFVILGRRRDAQAIEVRVYASPAGTMAKPVAVPFGAAETQKIRKRFFSGLGADREGDPFDQQEMTVLGKRLAAALFPPPVFELLARSLADVMQRPAVGLRLRLALDATLVDLPWEYVYRPDQLQGEGLSGFLLLDPCLSLVREVPNPRMTLEPIAGRQRLHFVGTLAHDKYDIWEVRREFESLQAALKPVAQYVLPDYSLADGRDAFGARLERGAAIFHYAGHCDFDADGRAFMIRNVPQSLPVRNEHKVHIDGVAASLRKSGTRLAVLSACNSGLWLAVRPFLEAEIPAVIGINGPIYSDSTIEFCKTLYESLSLGLTLDESVVRARLHVLEWDHRPEGRKAFDWGLYMVYMPSPQAVLFPRAPSKALKARQDSVRRNHRAVVTTTLQRARELDRMNFAEVMSALTMERVLILGRFSRRRRKVLETIRDHLNRHPNRYKAELFTYEKSKSRDLVESIISFAGLSRFIIADISEPKSVQSELQEIVPRFLSVPVVPLINQGGREYATFPSLQRRENVIKPTVRYKTLPDLMRKLDAQVVPQAEAKLTDVRPPARS